MIRLLHLADLHLGASLSQFSYVASTRADDLANAFERAMDFAANEDNRIDAVLIAGDLFDTPSPRQKWADLVVRKVREARRKGIDVVAVPGNHDATGLGDSLYADQQSPLSQVLNMPRSPQVEKFHTIDADGTQIHFYGLAYQPGISKAPYDQFRADGESGYHVAIIHGTLSDLAVGKDHANYIPLDTGSLAGTGMDYIALGHVHSPVELNANGVKIVYPGTLEGKRYHPGECGPRFLTIVELDDSRKAKIEKIVWNAREVQIATLDLGSEPVETNQELADTIRDRFGNADVLLRLTMIGTAPFVVDPEDLQSRLQGEFFHLDLVDKADVFDTKIMHDWQQEDTIRGLFVRKLLEKAEASDSEDVDSLELALKLAVQAFRQSGRS